MSRAKRQNAAHGTHTRYTAGCRCRPCKDAHADYARQLRAERRQRGYVPAQPVRLRLRALRRTLSLQEIAARADVSYSHLSRIANGRTTRCYIDTRDAIFGVDRGQRAA